MKAVIGTIFLSMSLCTSSWAAVGSSEEMLSACKEITQAKVSAEGISLPNTYEAGYCWGAFMTVQKVIKQANADGTPIFGVCAPPESTLSQIVAIYSDFAIKNPSRLHEHYFNVAIDALRAAFPCKSARKSG